MEMKKTTKQETSTLRLEKRPELEGGFNILTCYFG